MRRILAALSVVVAGLMLSFAPVPASATLYGVNISMTSPDTVNIAGIGNVLMGPQTVTMSTGQEFLAWCIDTYHYDHLGNQDPVIAYDVVPFTTDYGPVGLNASQIGRISWLLNFARTTTLTGQAYNAIQGGIWQIEGRTVATGDSGLQALIDGYGASVNVASSDNIRVLATRSGQGLAFAVPEPGTWALMILGFGGMGMMLRHRRRQFAFA